MKQKYIALHRRYNYFLLIRYISKDNDICYMGARSALVVVSDIE